MFFNDGFAYRIGFFIPSKPGKTRGQSEPIIKYTYEKIYNAKAFNAFSVMPRLGHKLR